jgi:hypothetical protein
VELVGSSETLVPAHATARPHTSVEHNVNAHHRYKRKTQRTERKVNEISQSVTAYMNFPLLCLWFCTDACISHVNRLQNGILCDIVV